MKRGVHSRIILSESWPSGDDLVNRGDVWDAKAAQHQPQGAGDVLVERLRKCRGKRPYSGVKPDAREGEGYHRKTEVARRGNRLSVASREAAEEEFLNPACFLFSFRGFPLAMTQHIPAWVKDVDP